MSIDNQIDDVVNEIHGQTVVSGASVKNKLIDIIQTLEDKSVDSNAPMGAIIDELHDAIINGAGGESPALYAPSLSRSGDTVTITNPSTNGGFVDEFKVYNGDEVIKTQSGTTFSLVGLGAGSYELYASATGENFEESAKSNRIKADVYTITRTLENLTANNSTTLISNGVSYSVTLTPASGYYLPEDIVVTMGGKAVGFEYNSYTGVISFPSVTGDISITAAALTTPKIRRPKLSISGTTLTITPATYSESTKLYIDDVLIDTYTGTSAATYDLSTSYSDYGIYTIKVKSEASGYDDSEYVQLSYKVGPTIAIKNGIITITSVTSGITAFRVFADGTELDFVEYDGSDDWSLDMSDYEGDVEDGKHFVELCACGTGVADNRSNAVAWFCGTAPIYGVSGLYNSAAALTRTDDAVDMTYSINSSTGAVVSDFDEVFPWSEAEIVNDTAGKFLKMPDMYFRVGVDNDGRITDIAVSSMPSGEGDWYEVPSFMYGCYGAGYQSSKLVSKTGIDRKYSTTRANFRSYAAANGSGYCQLDLYHRTVMMFLWWIEFANKNSQSIMRGRESGQGTAGGSSRRQTGGTDGLETPSGFETTYGQMRYHYIEDFVGNLWEFVDGICCDNWNTAYKVTDDPSKFDDVGTNMSATSYKSPPSSSGNCIAAYGWDEEHPFLCMPCAVVNNGSYNTYFCDQIYLNGSSYPVLYCGSSYGSNGARYGLSYCSASNVGGSLDGLGARLLKLS